MIIIIMNKWNTRGGETICVFVVALGRSPRVEGFTYAAATIAVTAVTTARSPLPSPLHSSVTSCRVAVLMFCFVYGVGGYLWDVK